MYYVLILGFIYKKCLDKQCEPLIKKSGSIFAVQVIEKP